MIEDDFRHATKVYVHSELNNLLAHVFSCLCHSCNYSNPVTYDAMHLDRTDTEV